ncbi:MAG: hypothetical protein KF817_12835 [Phycisphaeraceae bacterium]|nr:hypothetical protein [Phycisphaeraceae bacterium]
MRPWTWTFPTLSKAQVRREAFEAEFFVSDAESQTDTLSRLDALVREVVQNSMDACDGRRSGPVRIRFSRRAAPAGPKGVDAIFDGLRPHLGVQPIGDARYLTDAMGQACECLVIEDFGTTGLGGDTDRVDDPAPDFSGPRQGFYWFFRNVGRSGKQGTDLGRWGLGKSVLHANSRINTIVALTVRAEDGRCLAMGQSVLRTHDLGGVRHTAEGFLHDTLGTDGQALPIEDVTRIEHVREVFGFSRDSIEPGLSIAIPWPVTVFDPPEIARSVIMHFFVPILQGRLVVEVETATGTSFHLDRSTIRSVSDRIGWSGSVQTRRHVAPPLALCRAYLSAVEHATVETVDLSPAGANRWREITVAPAQLARLRTSFAAGDAVIVRVPVTLHCRAQGTVATSFDVAIQIDPRIAERSGEDVYVRDGMAISGMRYLTRAKGIRGLLIVTDPILSELLGDSEGPSHQSWNTNERRPNEKFTGWRDPLLFTRSALSELHQLLADRSVQRDVRHLIEIFSIDRSRTSLSGGAIATRNGSQETPPPTLAPVIDRASEKWYELTGLSDGFRLRSRAPEMLPLGAPIVLTLAYDNGRTNPVPDWTPADFDLRSSTDIHTDVQGAVYRFLDGNSLELIPTSHPLDVRARGFDRNVDLYVRIDDVNVPAAAGADGADEEADS